MCVCVCQIWQIKCLEQDTLYVWKIKGPQMSVLQWTAICRASLIQVKDTLQRKRKKIISNHWKLIFCFRKWYHWENLNVERYLKQDRPYKSLKVETTAEEGIMLDPQVQELAWKCNVFDHVLLSKAGYVNHMKFHWECESDILSLRLRDNCCVICSKVCKSLFGFKGHMAFYKNLCKEPNKVTSKRHHCLSVISA